MFSPYNPFNEHIYPPNIRKLKYHSEGAGLKKSGTPLAKSCSHKKWGFKLAIDVNSDYFEMKFKGHRLDYGATSKFNSTVTNVYLVYKLNLYKNVSLPKYPLVNALFGAIKVDRKGSKDPEKWYYHGKGVAIDSSGGSAWVVKVWVVHVIIFRVDNKLSLHPVNRSHNFMVLGNGNTQLVENVNSIPERNLAVNMTYPGKSLCLVFTILGLVVCFM